MRVRFVIRKARINKIGACPINCRITINSIKANEFAVGISVEPEKWDSKRQRVKGSAQKVLDLNRRLDLVKSDLEEIFLSSRAKGTNLTAQDVKEIYTGEKELNYKISKLGEMYLAELTLKERSQLSIKRYERFYKYLVEYLRSDMLVESVERRHVSGFWAWLRKKKYKIDYCNKIIQSCMSLFKYGIREGAVTINPFSGIVLEWDKELDTTFLSDEEVEAIKKVKWSDRLQKVADSFLFMCYTGLHISDYIAVDDSATYFVDDVEFMKIRRVKTNIIAMFPVHSYAKHLIEKYGGVDKLPRISVQKSNDYLKFIAERIGTSKVLTNKTARKTFTNMALNEYNMSGDSVARMLGLTTTKLLKHYGSVSEKRIYAEWKDRVMPNPV